MNTKYRRKVKCTICSAVIIDDFYLFITEGPKLICDECLKKEMLQKTKGPKS